MLADGRLVEIYAADEDLTEIRAASPEALTALAWHLGNRHLPAEIGPDCIRIGRDRVISDMLVRSAPSFAISAPRSRR